VFHQNYLRWCRVQLLAVAAAATTGSPAT
jgi:hypothetical protein